MRFRTVHALFRMIFAAGALMIAGGCADWSARSSAGLQLVLDIEAQRMELQRHGFPQYVPPP